MGKVNPEEYDMVIELVDKDLRQVSSNHEQRLHSLAHMACASLLVVGAAAPLLRLPLHGTLHTLGALD